MIKLRELLFEGQLADLEKQAMEALRAVKSKVSSKIPQGFGGFEVAWISYPRGDKKEITILYDTPREVRHPDEYPHADESRMKKWMQFDNAVWKAIMQLEKKFKDVEIGIAGDVSYPSSWPSGKTGRPRTSRF